MRRRRYDAYHEKTRKALLPYAYGQLCHFCGRVMEPGQALDLDHDDDGVGYRGMAHARCNRKAGAQRKQFKYSRRW